MNAVLKPAASGGAVECIIPTTESQREVWLGASLSPEASMAYNESVVLRLRGELDHDALARSMGRLLERHQALRSTISPDGTCMLVSHPGGNPMAEHDLAGLAPDARALALRDAHDEAVCTPFSLEHGPLFRAALRHFLRHVAEPRPVPRSSIIGFLICDRFAEEHDAKIAHV